MHADIIKYKNNNLCIATITKKTKKEFLHLHFNTLIHTGILLHTLDGEEEEIVMVTVGS